MFIFVQIWKRWIEVSGSVMQKEQTGDTTLVILISNVLMVSVFIWAHCIPQSAILTPFRTPISPISQFDLFGFNLVKSEKCSKVCRTLLGVSLH